MRRAFLLSIVITLAIAGSASAQGFAKAGTAGLQFLKIGFGGKAAAMGESFVALADDASALYWNPAGIARIEGLTLLGSYINWPAEVNISSAGLTFNLGSAGSVGLSLTNMNTGYMNVRTVYMPEGTGDVFTVSDFMVGITYARNLTDRFSFGASAKYIQEELEEYDDNSVGFDVGTIYDIGFKNLKLGMSILNFGPNLNYPIDEDGDGEFDEDPEDQMDNDGDGLMDEDKPQADVPLPMMFRVGLSMVPYMSDEAKLSTALEAVHPSDNVETLHFGAEYAFRDLLFLRSGYKVNSDLGGWTFGVGLKMKGIGIDYAYSDMKYLDNAQRISFSLSF